MIKIILLFLTVALNLFALNHPPYIDENITVKQISKLLANDGESYDNFGISVSMDGDFVIVGADKGDTNETDTGSAYIFQKNSDGTFSEIQEINASDRVKNDYFGHSVAISGDYAVVGAFGKNSRTGSAYIFHKNSDGTWSETQKLTLSDANDYDYFGYSVAIDGDLIVVGAYGRNSYAGRAYIFQQDSDGTWSQTQEINASDEGESFGVSVSIDGDLLVVGAYGKDNYTGSAYIFHKNSDGTWSETQEIEASDKVEGDHFGYSVCVKGDLVIAGAYEKDSYTGSAYIFQQDSDGTWSEIKKLNASDREENDYFGYSVAINDTIATVGAFHKYNESGSVYTFQKDENGTFEESDKQIGDNNTTSGIYLGISVALSEEYMISGATYGMNSDGYGYRTGSAYIYQITHNVDSIENQTFVEDLNITDPDGDDFNITLSGDDSDKFDLESNGTLTFKSAPDYENPGDANGDNVYEILLTATDAKGAVSKLYIKVTITDSKDEDGDGMDDDWEIKYFGDTSRDGTGDYDGDGLTDKEEFDYDTDPTLVDTDGDGVSDKDEIDNGTDPNANDNLPPYMDENTTATQVQKLLANDGLKNDYFGYSVAIDGDYAVVGAFGKNSRTGSAYIFHKNSDGTWSETQEINASDGVENDYFGYSVAIDGDYAVVGAYGKDNETGSAYIFHKNSDGTWSETQEINASDREEKDYFGYSVSISGDYVVVGAYGKDLNTGSAYIFQKNSDGTWSQIQKLTGSDSGDRDNFGYNVFIKDSFIIVGAKEKDNGTGSAYIFRKGSDGTFSEVQKLTASDGGQDDYFGYSVAIKDGYAIVGAYGKDNETGSAYIFHKNSDGTWSQTQEINASDGVDGDRFGYGVAIDDEYIIVGAYKKNNYTGSAYLFQKDENGTFKETNKISANDANTYDYFAVSVAISNGYVISGAYCDDDKGDDSGSAYIYQIIHNVDSIENQTFVEDLNITDPNGDDFNITLSGDDSDKFDLESNGTLTFKSAPDYENPGDANGDNVYEILLTATDAKGAVSKLYIKVTVTDSKDEDGDGMDDDWEIKYFGDTSRDGTEDYDKDGLTDKEEFDYNTDPTLADTDGDGVSDKDEIDNGTDPNANDNLPPYMNENTTTYRLQRVTTGLGANDDKNYGYSVSMDGEYAIIGAPGDTIVVENSNINMGSAYIFKRDENGTFSEVQKLIPSDGELSDKFGYSVSISGDYAVVGANQKDSYAGSAYIFHKNSDGTWSQIQEINASDKAEKDFFGSSVSIDGEYIVVGAYGKDSYTGSAYIYKKDENGTFSQIQEIEASDKAENDNFGNSVSIYENFIVVGAYEKDNYTGSAYIFRRDSQGDWSQIQKLTANDKAEYDKFGYSVSVNGGYIVVGAKGKDNATGSAYIFKKDNRGVWSETQKIEASDKTSSTSFGNSVAIKKYFIVAGSYQKNDGKGSAYVFHQDINDTFIETNEITAEEEASNDEFGVSVAVNDGYVISGAYGIDDNASDSGGFYTFQIAHDADIMENKTFVEDLNITDPNGDDFNITLNGVDSDKFDLESNGTLSFKSAPDHENPTDENGDNIYNIIVKATDTKGAYNVLNINVTVLDDDDEDNDSMSDKWEREYFGDTSRDGTGDYDGDGLSDKEEYDLGTKPDNNDSDGDGLSDYDEVKVYDTNASNIDTDGDEINDYDEVKVYDTNASNIDTDGDGANDKVELNLDTNATDSSSFIKLNQDASQTKDYIILTPNEGNKAGSAFVSPPHDINDTVGFEAHFKMEIKGSGDDADGMAFILQNDDRNETAVGGTGGAIGYADINNSIAVAFITYTTNEIRIYKNGDMNVVLASAPFPSYVKGGGAFYVWVDYVVSAQEIRVYLSQSDTKPITPILRYTIDLNSTLNGRAFVGFSGGTGGLYEEHDVYSFDINWTIDSDKDGLLDSDESKYGTDPNNDDTDGDGTKDGLEVKFDLNATNSNEYIKINQDAYEKGDYIVLTPNEDGKAGSTFISPPHDINDTVGFESHFKMEIKGSGDDADGMAFILQNDDRNETAVGGTGGAIGYADINNSIAVAFVTYTTNEIRIYKNGDMDTVLASTPFPTYVKGGGAFYVWVDYSAFDQNLTVYTSQSDTKPTDPLLQCTVDLNATLKGRAFMGFSGGTGGLYEEHDAYSLDINWTLDSDKDGLLDSDEENVYDTNASNPDTDGDGLGDYDEIKTYDTNASNPDTDGDGLTDYEEIKTYDTNATNPDTDGDGLTDYEEIKVYGTDPKKADTDEDGVNDKTEIDNGDDPTTASLDITPTAYLFGSSSGTKTFQVTNTGSSDATLPAAELKGAQSSSFAITDDECNGVTLHPNQECNITVSYPSSDEPIATTLDISNVEAFIYNYESLDSESSRRLPPVIDELNIPESMDAGTDYNLTFSIVGYDKDYRAYIAFFNCDGIPENECGDSYNSSERFDQALDLHPYLIEQSSWSYNSKVANKFHYSYVFNPPSDKFKDGNTTIVIRFYYKTDKDSVAGDPSISLIIPGNLSDKYDGTSGRKIEKTVVK